MNRQDLINRLVARKLQTPGKLKAGCVPCFGTVSRPEARPARAFCFAASQPKK